MKRLFTGTCLAALCAATLSAQTPSQPPASSASQDTMKTVTATGCLRAGEQPNSFVLSNVKWADKAPGATAGTSGTAASPSPSASSLRLIAASAGAQLTENIGKTVEVTGTIDKSPSAAAPPAGEQPAAKAKDEPTLNVRTVKMVSSSCDSK